MTDLDNELRTVARMLVADAPPPPPLSAIESVTMAPAWRRPSVVLAAAAAGAVAVAAVVLLPADSPRPSAVAAAGDKAKESTAACAGPLPFALEVPDATGGPVEGPAPGAAEPAAGQLVRHWPRAEGAVEVRWPATPQPLYGDGAVTPPSVGQAMRPGSTAIDVAPPSAIADLPPSSTTADVVVTPGDAAPPAAGCEVVQLSVTTAAGTWVSGLRKPTNGSQSVYEPVDLQPRIVEKRDVSSAPRDAVTCRGADRNGTPPNRVGGARPEWRGAEPADALLAFLAANPTSPPSGYVEMRASDGSVTYGADPSGTGWTTLVNVRSGPEGWYVAATSMSGC
ncbi:MAG: hypothetical protein M3394_04985 [Actinomycetota bacterium]|nr:hypothetical protein [Actinomycetota bacterium]